MAAAGLALVSGEALVAGEYVVEISGTEGTAFGGTCLLITANDRSSHAASGSVPLVLRFSGDVISCAVQRKAGSARLQIVIRNSEGRVVGASTETLPFGVVIAAGR